MKKSTFLHLTSVFIFFCSTVSAHDGVHSDTHSNNPRGIEAVDFSAVNISRVVTAGYPVSFGVYAFTRREPLKYITVNTHINGSSSNRDHSCVKANFLAFDVDDNYAFDINENVTVELLIDPNQTSSLVYGFDQHGSEKANGQIKLELSATQESNNVGKLRWVKTTLNKARFANRGISGTDFVITTNETMLADKSLPKGIETTLVLCDIKITRNKSDNQGIKAINKVQVNFNFTDDKAKTPVRLGLYTNDGSAVLLNNNKIRLPYYEDNAQQHSLPAFYPPFQYWPHSNRYYSYVDSQFSQLLKPGVYTLVATKGPEYRISSRKFTVTSEDKNINVEMERWLDLPKLGWYSGDVHIHIKREQKDNENLAKVFKAEDLHFSNLLEMSTTENNHFKQYSFGKDGIFNKDDYTIVPGIEGPRTAYRGHAIALNVKQVYQPKDSFFLYHKYFDFYKKQQAIIGYAHVGSKEFNASLGLALDMPFDLVDFVEIMQSQRLRTGFWYEFLNLGYKLAPAAGSDFPYFEQPGAVRSYVKMSTSADKFTQSNNTQQWYQHLKEGNTFVSNAPFIELSINNKGIGSTLSVLKNPLLSIQAKVSVNADYDHLAQLELVHCGKVIKQLNAKENGKKMLNFQLQISNEKSGWIALRAKGVNYALAHTGAIYLEDEQGNSQCKEQAPAIIDIMLTRLDTLKQSQVQVNKELEYWEALKLNKEFTQQKSALDKRIESARKFYHKMQENLLGKNN